MDDPNFESALLIIKERDAIIERLRAALTIIRDLDTRYFDALGLAELIGQIKDRAANALEQSTRET